MKGKGWGIPFPRVKSKPSGESRKRTGPRTDEELLALQQEWIANYRRRLHAFRLLGISIGTPADEVEAQYARLARHLSFDSEARQALDAAYRLVISTDEVNTRGTGESRDGGSGADGAGGHGPKSRRTKQRGAARHQQFQGQKATPAAEQPRQRAATPDLDSAPSD